MTDQTPNDRDEAPQQPRDGGDSTSRPDARTEHEDSARPGHTATDEQRAFEALLPEAAAKNTAASEEPHRTTGQGDDDRRAPTTRPADSTAAHSVDPKATADDVVEIDTTPTAVIAHDAEQVREAGDADELVVTPVAPYDLPTATPLLSDRNVSVRSLARTWRGRSALRDVTFVAQAGQITTLIGPNGAGKTTLLQILATLIKPTRGDVRVSGVDLIRQPADVRPLIGWAPADAPQWPRMSTRGVLKTFARLCGYSAREAKGRADVLLELTGLTRYAKTPVQRLSRGHSQSLNVARALINDPQVVLLDEPAAGLEPAARARQRTLLRSLAKEGKVVIVSSHALDEISEFSDSTVFLYDGTTATAEQVAQAERAPRIWHIVSLDPATLLDALRRMDVAFSVDDDSQSIEVLVETPTDAELLLARLVIAGVPVTSFAPAHQRLAETYMALSQGVA